MANQSWKELRRMNVNKKIDMKDCIFCKIIDKEAPAEIICETDSCLAFFPLRPATKGHTLVVPKRHVSDFTNAEPRFFGNLSSIAVEISKRLLMVYSPDGMNMITSAGQAATQSVMHLHIHLVPRWAKDEMGEIWPSRQHTSPATLALWADEFRTYVEGDRG